MGQCQSQCIKQSPDTSLQSSQKQFDLDNTQIQSSFLKSNEYISPKIDSKPHINLQKVVSQQNYQNVPSESEIFTDKLQLNNKDIIIEKDGRYEGDVVSGIKEGNGVYYYNNGDKLEGCWVNGELQVQCKVIRSNGDIYQGEWKDNKANGYGTVSLQNNAKFLGIQINPSGERYEGDYQDGKKQGFGQLLFKDGAIYEGEFKEDLIEGTGQYQWPDGKLYSGMWKANQMHGIGKLQWSDGKRYEGDFFQDKREGNGNFYWTNGKQFQGKWKNGKQDGIGLYINSKGKCRKGLWEDGKRIRWFE